MTVDVVVPLPVDKPFTYEVPQQWKHAVEPGTRVLVPFGRRRLTGVVVGRGAEPDELEFSVKEILEVLDDRPALPESMLKLCRWIADYYVCGWGEAVKAALATGTGVRSVVRLTRTELSGNGWEGPDAQKALLQDLEQHGTTTLSAARKRLSVAVSLDDVRALQSAHLIDARSEVSDASVQVKTQRHLRLAPAFRHDNAVRDVKEQLRGAKQQAVVEVLAGLRLEGVHEPLAAEVRKRASAARSTVRSLIDKGIVEIVEKETKRSRLDDLPPPSQPADVELHHAQDQALGKISKALRDEQYRTFLLHGITGSGKTEVYLRALGEVIARGQTAIVLVPEIALTPQTVQRFRAHFEGEIAVLHSQMGQGERFDAWRGLRDGEFSIAIGPRSAVLAPLQNIGLIVVDEEHESSYKQFEPDPRYHARDVAVMRAHQANAVCILGSATPSLESRYNAEEGKYAYLHMPERVPTAQNEAALLPDVHILDLRRQSKMGQLEGTISEPLREAIRERLGRDEQSILLHNRRGFASVLECEACGHTPECPNCSVTLTYHKARAQLRCHYCGYARRMPQACPACQEDALEQLGSGTQRVEEELAHCFPESTILRMDRDTTSRKNAHRKILNTFEEGRADILLGTQMIAKGLDFSRVTLVGVINTDVGLMMPDFRAEERTFQLLTQVAGRAGRADLPGEVYLQTRNPEHPVIKYARKHDYESFAKAALRDRETLGYPPYGRLIAVQFKGTEETQTGDLAQRWTAAIKNVMPSHVEVLGPEPPVISRIKKYHRYQTVLRIHGGLGALRIQKKLREVQEKMGSSPRGYHVAINVDAVNLL